MYEVNGRIKLLLVTKGDQKQKKRIHEVIKVYSDEQTIKFDKKSRETYEDNVVTLKHFKYIFEDPIFEEIFISEELVW